jgi:DNA topoisomerase-1
VKRLEELGIGRPSTYASIISTIQDRGYVWKKGSALVPTFTAFAVTPCSSGTSPTWSTTRSPPRWRTTSTRSPAARPTPSRGCRSFYFGDEAGERRAGRRDGIARASRRWCPASRDIDARDVNSIPLGADARRRPEIVARVGRYGPYLKRGDDTANIPDDIAPDELTSRRPSNCWRRAEGTATRHVGPDPDSGPIFGEGRPVRPLRAAGRARRRDRVQAEDGTASLFKTMTVERLTLEDALNCWRCPRGGRRSRRRRGDHGAERPVRPLHQEGHRHPVDRDRGAALHDHPRRRRADLGRAEAPPRADRQGPAARARARSRFGPPDRPQGRPLRPVRDRRRDQRLAAQGRLVEELTTSGRSSCSRTVDAKAPAPKKAAKKKAPAKKAPAKKKAREEGARQEGRGQEGRRPRRPRRSSRSRRSLPRSVRRRRRRSPWC